MDHLGILAYGSLIDEPGEELAQATSRRVPRVSTPFSVEFQRSSRSRDGAPTLIPVDSGGAPVTGVVLLLKDIVDEETAASMLWRRETGRMGRYDPSRDVDKNTVVIERLQGLGDIDVVLYTRIAANIGDPRPQRLAELAVNSARAEAGVHRRDGITYLIRAKQAGISTPLMPAYEQAILRICGVASLEEAWEAARARSTER